MKIYIGNVFFVQLKKRELGSEAPKAVGRHGEHLPIRILQE